jgi:Putative metallopeptidase
MIRIAIANLLRATGLTASLLVAGSAAAQTPAPAGPELKNPGILIDYVEPPDPQFQELYERLKRRRVLEQLAQFLSPLKLPLKLRIKFEQCDMINADYSPYDLRVRICYDLIQYMEERAPAPGTPLAGFITREDAIAGMLVSVILHELGHALFDLLDVPVLGKEEDAADQIAGFIMLQFDKQVARTTINGSAFAWITFTRATARPAFYDSHSTPQQRVVTFACIGYGGDPDTFKDYVDSGLLPKARAANCKREYEQVKTAFTSTILPHIDLALMKEVQSRTWDLSIGGR